MSEFTLLECVRGKKFESYYFQASEGWIVCAEMHNGRSEFRVLKNGCWIVLYPGVDYDIYDFMELIERGRACTL